MPFYFCEFSKFETSFSIYIASTMNLLASVSITINSKT